MTARRASSRGWLAGSLAVHAIMATAALTGGARAERPLLADELPADLNGVGIVERLGEEVPKQARFTDDAGKAVSIGDYFQGERPVILTLNYYRCPMLCDMTLNGLVDGMRDMKWSVGEDFDIVTVSVSPDEAPDLASVKKRGYVQQYGRETAARGWHFLTGDKENIEALAKAVGFGYRHVPETNDFAHTASIMFVTPDGRLSRYMNDVVFEARDLRLGLVEASKGSIGSPMEKFLLFMCYQYDPDANSYAMSAMKLMRLGGLITLLAIVTGLVVLWRRGSHHSDREEVAIGGLQP